MKHIHVMNCMVSPSNETKSIYITNLMYGLLNKIG